MSTQQHADNLCNLIMENYDYPSQSAWYEMRDEAFAVASRQPIYTSCAFSRESIRDIERWTDTPDDQETWHLIRWHFLMCVAEAATQEGYADYITEMFPDLFTYDWKGIHLV